MKADILNIFNNNTADVRYLQATWGGHSQSKTRWLTPKALATWWQVRELTTETVINVSLADHAASFCGGWDAACSPSLCSEEEAVVDGGCTPPLLLLRKGWVMALLGSRPLGLAGVYSQDVESWVLRERKAPRHAGCCMCHRSGGSRRHGGPRRQSAPV